MGLNMYELLPFWHTFFTRLNFEVVVSPRSDRKLYLSGQQTIPSDTVCFPAKADARSRRGAARRGSRRDILSLHDLQLRRGSRRQPLQLSGRRLLSRGHRREYAGARRRKIHQGLHRSTHRPKDFAKLYTLSCRNISTVSTQKRSLLPARRHTPSATNSSPRCAMRARNTSPRRDGADFR